MPISVMATTITLNNSDDANEGLNDPTPSLPVGGNIGNTVGQQRVIVFEYAAALVASVINSAVPIRIEAKFDPLTCDATSGILGLAGPNGFHQNFLGTPLINTFYSQAQANSLSGADLNPSTDDMGMTFNSSVDNNSGCLDNRNWYYGLDGNPPNNDIDFLTTVLHEVRHGIGFLIIMPLCPTTAKVLELMLMSIGNFFAKFKTQFQDFTDNFRNHLLPFSIIFKTRPF